LAPPAPPLEAPPLEAPPLEAPPLEAPPLEAPPFDDSPQPCVRRECAATQATRRTAGAMIRWFTIPLFRAFSDSAPHSIELRDQVLDE
jgi:hypothetical protein